MHPIIEIAAVFMARNLTAKRRVGKRLGGRMLKRSLRRNPGKAGVEGDAGGFGRGAVALVGRMVFDRRRPVEVGCEDIGIGGGDLWREGRNEAFAEPGA